MFGIFGDAIIITVDGESKDVAVGVRNGYLEVEIVGERHGGYTRVKGREGDRGWTSYWGRDGNGGRRGEEDVSVMFYFRGCSGECTGGVGRDGVVAIGVEVQVCVSLAF